MKKRNFVSIICMLLIHGQTLSAIDIFKPVAVLTTLYCGIVESFTPLPHRHLEKSLYARPFQRTNADESPYTYQNFSRSLSGIENSIHKGANPEQIDVHLASVLMIAGMNIDLRPEDQIKAAQLYIKNNNPETAIEILKEVINENLLTENLSWPVHLKCICNQLEALRTLASLKKEYTFIKDNLDKIKDITTLAPRDRLNIAKIYLSIQEQKNAVIILKDLSFSNPGNPIDHEARSFLQDLDKKETYGL